MYMISPNGKKAKEVRMYKIKYALSYFQYGLHNHSMLFMLFFKRFIINLLFNHYTRIFAIYIKFSHIVLWKNVQTFNKEEQIYVQILKSQAENAIRTYVFETYLFVFWGIISRLSVTFTQYFVNLKYLNHGKIVIAHK